jgi:hypothetical protein
VEINHSPYSTVDQGHGRHHVWLCVEIQIQTSAHILLFCSEGRREGVGQSAKEGQVPDREDAEGRTSSPRTRAATPSTQRRVGEEEYKGLVKMDREMWRGVLL